MKRTISDTQKPIKIWASTIEGVTEAQIRNVAALPFIFSHVAVMPDAHLGKGSTIGTVIATRGAILPAAVGVDIGCGMCAVRLPIRTEALGDLKALRHSIERSIPVGRDGNRGTSERTEKVMTELGLPPSLGQENQLLRKAMLQLGSLGGGNHFIEICGDTEGQAWILLHSGSRNIGKELADKHIDRAKGIAKERMLELPDPDLAYFTEEMPEFAAYIGDMLWAQRFAKENRNEMILRIIKDVSHHAYKDARLTQDQLFRIDCHHNYCQMEEHFGTQVWLTRKGAVSAKTGEYGIIPGSMGTQSFIVKGKGNPDSFHSCSHGAGRKMSRTEARNQFSEMDFVQQTKGVECRKDKAVLDEIPGAYKDIHEVMNDQTDLVDIAFELKQVLCVKG